jgi:hypothetical protein
MNILRLRPMLALLSFIGPDFLRRLVSRRRPRVLVKGKRHGQRLGAGAFEQLERREVFTMTYHSGAVIREVEAQPVFLGSGWDTSSTLANEAIALDGFMHYAVQSPYMDMLTDAGYGVGQGTAVSKAVIDTTLPATVTDVQIRSLLQQAIDLKLVAQPTQNRLYVIYMPTGVTVNDNGATSQTTFLGYHGAFAGKDVSGVPFDLRYVVVPHPGTPNPTSTSQGFNGAAEVETLTLGGGSASGTLTPSFNGVFATTPIIRANETQQLTVSTPAGSSITLGFNSVPAPTPITPTTDFQSLTIGGTDAGTITLSYNGVSGSAATKLTKTTGSSPTAQQVLDHLNSIPDLTGNVSVAGNVGGPFTITFDGPLAGSASLLTATLAGGATAAINPLVTVANVQASLDSIPALHGNVTVTGSVGGPFTLTFGGTLADANVNLLTAITTSGGATATIAAKLDPLTGTSDGNNPTAAQVLASLNTIAALNGNVTVTGNAGGPFIITIKNLGNVSPINVTGVTGGLTASITTVTDGIAGLTSDLDELTSVTSHEMAEAVTDPDVNYKTLGWYDEVNNIEIGDILNETVTDVPNNSVRMGPNGYFMQRVYDQAVNLVTPDTTTVALPALSGVSVAQISLNKAQVSWTPVASGATGYRVYLVGANSQLTLLGRVPAINPATHLPNTSLTISGLPAGVAETLRVEAYNAGSANAYTDVPYTQTIPALTAPVITSHVQNPAAPATSAQLTWTGSMGAAGYRVFLVQGTTRKQVVTLSDTTTSATISGLPAGSRVTFIVEAFRGSLKKDSAAASVQLQALTLKAPVVKQPTAVNGNPSVVLLSWSVAPNSLPPSGFRIYRQSGSSRILVRTLSSSALSATISGLPVGTKFQIEAFRGTQVADSAWVHG